MSDPKRDKGGHIINKSTSKARGQSSRTSTSSGQQTRANLKASQSSSRKQNKPPIDHKPSVRQSTIENKKPDSSQQQSRRPEKQSPVSKNEDSKATVSKSSITFNQDNARRSSEEADSSEMFTHRLTSDGSQSSTEHLEQETDLDSDQLLSKGEEEARRLLLETDLADRTQTPVAQTSSSDKNLPQGWEQHSDKQGLYYWHVSSGVIQRTRPNGKLPEIKQLTKDGGPAEVVVYHDDEEINQEFKNGSSSEGDDYYETGAALTADDTSESTFVVYPMGCCEFDETQLVSTISSTRAIQKSILRLSSRPKYEETFCWGLDQSQPILMKLFDDHIQFTDMSSQMLLRSQPIQTIKTWAVDDNNNFAFVIEDRASGGGQQHGDSESLDYALLNEPTLMCYIFRSIDDDDMMSCKVASKLNEEINRYKEQLMDRITKSTRLQQMVEPSQRRADQTVDHESESDDEFDEELEASNELTMEVKYIGKIAVPRPTGIEILNAAIDKCLSDATSRTRDTHEQETNLDHTQEQVVASSSSSGCSLGGPLLEARLHVSPSSVIVENLRTGEIIVECRIRYLTFMGISRRDIRWCGFIMQNAISKSFEAHCFECHPTAGHVCEAIQTSCTKMYEKVLKQSSARSQSLDLPESVSIIPSGSQIRNTLAKTFSRIKLNPIK